MINWKSICFDVGATFSAAMFFLHFGSVRVSLCLFVLAIYFFIIHSFNINEIEIQSIKDHLKYHKNTFVYFVCPLFTIACLFFSVIGLLAYTMDKIDKRFEELTINERSANIESLKQERRRIYEIPRN